jgi:hypothetical protein
MGCSSDVWVLRQTRAVLRKYLRQAGLARRTFRIRAFKQQFRMRCARVDLALCGVGMPVQRFRAWIVPAAVWTYI